MMELFSLMGQIAIDNQKANDAIDDTTGKAEESEGKVSSAFKKIGGAILTYLSVDAIKDFGSECIDMASDVQEMENKFNVVFGNTSKDVNDWATNFATSIGRNKNGIKSYLADNQNLLVGMGMTRETGAKLSENMVSLAMDIASFSNINEGDAVNAMSKALMGESESAKTLGTVLNDNTIAMAQEKLGYQGKFDSLTEAQKMEVRYQAILMQSKDAVGDCERSMGSYKSTQVQATAKTEEFKETIGKHLLPVMAKVNEVIGTVMSGATKLVNWMSENKTILTVIGSMISALAVIIGIYNLVLNASAIAAFLSTAALTAFGAVLAFVTSPITLVIIAIGLLIAGIVLLVKHWDQVKEVAVKCWNAIVESVSNAWEKIKNIFSAVGGFFKGVWDTIASIFTKIGTTIGDAIGGAFKAVVNSIINFAEKTINGFLKAINGAIGIINNIPGVKITKLSLLDIPEMAKGGVLEKGQM